MAIFIHFPSKVGEREALVGEQPSLLAQRVALVGERLSLLVDRVALIGQQPSLVGEREALVPDREALVGQREPLVVEQPSLIGQRVALIADRLILIGDGSLKGRDRPAMVWHWKTPLSRQNLPGSPHAMPLSPGCKILLRRQPDDVSQRRLWLEVHAVFQFFHARFAAAHVVKARRVGLVVGNQFNL